MGKKGKEGEIGGERRSQTPTYDALGDGGRVAGGRGGGEGGRHNPKRCQAVAHIIADIWLIYVASCLPFYPLFTIPKSITRGGHS